MTDNAFGRRCLLTLAAGTVAGLAGCGSGEDSTTSTATTDDTETPTDSDRSSPTQQGPEARTGSADETLSGETDEGVRGNLTISVDGITPVGDWETHTSEEYSLFSVSIEVENTGQREIDIFDYDSSISVYDDTGDSIVTDSSNMGIATTDKVMGPGERGTPSFSAEVPDPSAVARFEASLSCPETDTEGVEYCE